MSESYFEYTLLQCRSQVIKNVCNVFSIRRELIKKAHDSFNGYDNITNDRRLFKSVGICFQNHSIIGPDKLNHDSLIVYTRCKDALLSEELLDYDQWFNFLTEVNWLFASIQYANQTNSRRIMLLSDLEIIRGCLRDYLQELYDSAVEYSNECVYINEALRARQRILTGLYPFEHEESRRYLSPDISYSYLESLLNELREKSIGKMALFYGLTATAALENEVRRFS